MEEPPLLHPVPPKTDRPRTGKSWLNYHTAIIVLIVLLGIKALVAPADSPRARRTVDDWIKQASSAAAIDYVQAGHLYAHADAFGKAVGEPDHIQTIGNNVHLSWNCRDGRVVAIVDRHTHNFGQFLVGEIRYYRN